MTCFFSRCRDATCAWLLFTVAAAAIAGQPAASSVRAAGGATSSQAHSVERFSRPQDSKSFSVGLPLAGRPHEGSIVQLGTATSAGTTTGSWNTPIESFRFDLQGEKWTYTSAGRTFEGYLLKPEGSGKFPAVIINHGKGGRPDQFSMQWAREMVKWGLVCIAPTLTHVAGTRIQGQDGASEENIARGIDCLAILERLGSVDLSRVAVIGHSMGAYASIGMAGTAPDRFRALAVCAGGLAPGAGFAAPPEEVAAKIRAPTLIVHGTVDRAVAPGMSAKLQEVLQARGVPIRRELFAGTDHDLPTNAATRAVVLALIHEHLATHGVLEIGNNTPPRLTVPADVTVASGQPAPALRFSVSDGETGADKLVVAMTSSNPKVLPPENLAVSGRGGERVLSAGAAREPGPTTVFVTVGDGRLMTTRSFTIGFANAEGIVPTPVIQRGPPPGMGKKKAP